MILSRVFTGVSKPAVNSFATFNRPRFRFSSPRLAQDSIAIPQMSGTQTRPAHQWRLRSPTQDRLLFPIPSITGKSECGISEEDHPRGVKPRPSSPVSLQPSDWHAHWIAADPD